MTNGDIERIARATAYDPTGDKLGKVGEVYVDDETGDPTFVSVNIGLFGSSESLVPVSGHTWNGDDLVLPYEKDVIKDAPNVDADRHISEQEQDDLFAYYAGLRSGTGRTISGERRAARGDAGEDVTLTRSEERLNVDKEIVETGRVRLRKYTTTEYQTVTVPVTKERVVVERIPVEGDDRFGGTIDTDGHEIIEEITTREERPVVSKETIEVEQVRLGKETVTEDETVSGQVRKEHIEIDGDVDDTRR